MLMTNCEVRRAVVLRMYKGIDFGPLWSEINSIVGNDTLMLEYGY